MSLVIEISGSVTNAAGVVRCENTKSYQKNRQLFKTNFIGLLPTGAEPKTPMADWPKQPREVHWVTLFVERVKSGTLVSEDALKLQIPCLVPSDFEYFDLTEEDDSGNGRLVKNDKYLLPEGVEGVMVSTDLHVSTSSEESIHLCNALAAKKDVLILGHKCIFKVDAERVKGTITKTKKKRGSKAEEEQFRLKTKVKKERSEIRRELRRSKHGSSEGEGEGEEEEEEVQNKDAADDAIVLRDAEEGEEDEDEEKEKEGEEEEEEINIRVPESIAELENNHNKRAREELSDEEESEGETREDRRRRRRVTFTTPPLLASSTSSTGVTHGAATSVVVSATTTTTNNSNGSTAVSATVTPTTTRDNSSGACVGVTDATPSGSAAGSATTNDATSGSGSGSAAGVVNNNVAPSGSVAGAVTTNNSASGSGSAAGVVNDNVAPSGSSAGAVATNDATSGSGSVVGVVNDDVVSSGSSAGIVANKVASSSSSSSAETTSTTTSKPTNKRLRRLIRQEEEDEDEDYNNYNDDVEMFNNNDDGSPEPTSRPVTRSSLRPASETMGAPTRTNSPQSRIEGEGFVTQRMVVSPQNQGMQTRVLNEEEIIQEVVHRLCSTRGAQGQGFGFNVTGFSPANLVPPQSPAFNPYGSGAVPPSPAFNPYGSGAVPPSPAFTSASNFSSFSSNTTAPLFDAESLKSIVGILDNVRNENKELVQRKEEEVKKLKAEKKRLQKEKERKDKELAAAQNGSKAHFKTLITNRKYKYNKNIGLSQALMDRINRGDTPNEEHYTTDNVEAMYVMHPCMHPKEKFTDFAQIPDVTKLRANKEFIRNNFMLFMPGSSMAYNCYHSNCVLNRKLNNRKERREEYLEGEFFDFEEDEEQLESIKNDYLARCGFGDSN